MKANRINFGDDVRAYLFNGQRYVAGVSDDFRSIGEVIRVLLRKYNREIECPRGWSVQIVNGTRSTHGWYTLSGRRVK